MTRTLVALSVALSALAAAQPLQQNTLTGDWREPGGSVIRIAPCNQDLCATLIHIGPEAPTRFDIHNPNPAKRSEHLCGLRIGYGFHVVDPTHANSGQLYDPKSGKTYHGEITANGNRLHLHGYVGIPLFGRTEVWKRTGPITPCG